MRWLLFIALALNGFAILTVNYLIYTARWDFIALHSQTYHEPPTISRAISDPTIGEPFSFWITVSAICLFLGVWVLIAYFIRHIGFLKPLRRYTWVGIWIFLPLLGVLQGVAGLGMYWLSAYRFPDHHEMHMVGSFTFFIAQALVVLLSSAVNHSLLRDRASLDYLVTMDVVSVAWVRVRFWFGAFCVAFTGVYFALFQLKNHYTDEQLPGLYLAYVSSEPALISCFLVVLGLYHVDIYRQRRS